MMNATILSLMMAVAALVPLSNAFSIPRTDISASSTTVLKMSSVASSPIASSNAIQLKAALKKPSKVLTVGVEYSRNTDSESERLSSTELSILSMQLRKAKVSAIWCSNFDDLSDFSKEQETAKGNFPGPCSVIYNGVVETSDDIQSAIAAGATAAAVDVNMIEEISKFWNEDIALEIIWKISNAKDLEKVMEVTGDLNDAAFLFQADPNSDMDGIGSALPKGSLLIASVESMQVDGNEIVQGKQLKSSGVASILMREACVGDAEDIEYSRFAVEGLTSKASSEFKFSGLTGSTNGHFGGVQSNGKVKWRRANSA